MTGSGCEKPKLHYTLRTRATDGVRLRCVKYAGKWIWQELLATAPVLLGPVAGFDGTNITLGILSTTTNPFWGPIGRAINAGIEGHFAAVNRKGGIGGKYPVRLITVDTNYDPQQTLTQYAAVAPRVVGFASVLGTPNVGALVPQLERDGVVASPASGEISWINRSVLLPVNNSYQVQAINGIAYYLDQPNTAGTTVCSVSVGSSFGEAGAEGVRFAQSRLGFPMGPQIAISPTETTAAPTLTKLRDAGCRAVVVTAAPEQTAALVYGGGLAGFTPRWIVLAAGFSERLVTAVTGSTFEQNVWVVGDGTSWDDPSAPGMNRIRRELIDSGNRQWVDNPDTGLAFGWVQARTWEVLLERAVANGDLSRTGIQKAMSQLGVVDLEGVGSSLDYSRSPRLPVSRATIFAVDNSQRNAIRPLRVGYESAAAAEYRK